MARVKACFVLLICLLMSGCWDQQEITALASITGLGFDVGGYPHTMRVSVMLSPPVFGAGGGVGGGGRLRVITVEAASFTEAMTLFQGHVRREIFFLHLGFVVFGEGAAKSGIDGKLSALQGRSTIRGSVPVFVAQGTAEEVLKARSGFGQTPGEDIANFLENFAINPLGRMVTIHDMRNILGGVGSEVTLPILELTPQRLQAGDERPEDGVGFGGEQLREVFIRRMAVFYRDRWVSDFDQYLVQAFVLLTGDTRKGGITIVNPADPLSNMGLTINHFRADFDIKIEGDKIELAVTPRIRASVREVSGIYSLRDRGLDPIAKTLEQEVNRQVLAVIAHLQENGSDALGFGDMIRRGNPKDWSRLKSRWGEMFPKIKVSVNSEAEIVGTAMLVRFFEVKRED